MSKKYHIFPIANRAELESLENEYRPQKPLLELLPWALNGTSYTEIVEKIKKDKGEGTPLYLIVSNHESQRGSRALGKRIIEFITENCDSDILSVSTCVVDGYLSVICLVRAYTPLPDWEDLYYELDEEIEVIRNKTSAEEKKTGKLVIPDDVQVNITEEEIREHERKYKKQCELLKNSTIDKPLLNMIEGDYVPSRIFYPEEDVDLIYDLKTADMEIKTFSEYNTFIQVFNEVMIDVNGTDYDSYINSVIEDGENNEETFMIYLKKTIINRYVEKDRIHMEDVDVLLSKLRRALFQMYVVQDLIDDPRVTDIKITSPHSIKARIHGKAYKSNISFIDLDDYLRFVSVLAIRNGISLDNPAQTFTDNNDENYILRFSLISDYITAEGWPYIHIRKISRKKLMDEELIKLNFFDMKIRDYLIDAGRNGRGVVFAGPPGSGKTVALNWFLERAYERSAEILVIQENDELFCQDREGVMFEHVVNYPGKGLKPVDLEELGSLALVAGANVFIIGEAKGGEICSAITLANSGCRTAITIHSPSSTETIDKMADLAMRGYAKNKEEAYRMLKSFQTIVYLENFSVKEISEITGYDENTHQMTYNYIYRKENSSSTPTVIQPQKITA